MTYKTFFFALLVLFTSNLEAQQENYIHIKHIGAQDVPIMELFINLPETACEYISLIPGGSFFHTHVAVSGETFEKIVAFIRKSNEIIKNPNGENEKMTGNYNGRLLGDWGTFGIIINEAGEQTFYYLLGVEISVLFFVDFVKELSNYRDAAQLSCEIENEYVRMLLGHLGPELGKYWLDRANQKR